jgi:hypothetical protein
VRSAELPSSFAGQGLLRIFRHMQHQHFPMQQLQSSCGVRCHHKNKRKPRNYNIQTLISFRNKLCIRIKINQFAS